jgi:cobalt-zinc-cadmium efflux system membrane fusion protein
LRQRAFVWAGAGVAAIAGVVVVLRWKTPTVIAAPPRDVPHVEGKWIRYSPEFASRSKIELAPAEEGNLDPLISVTGTVTFDPQLVAALGSRISGRVRMVAKFPGDAVKAGDVVAEIESAELGNAQAAVAAARAHAEAAIANEKREGALAEAHVSSQRDAEMAHASASAAKAELLAAEQKVSAMGGTTSGTIGVLALTSPIAGKLVELNVSRGQSVEPTFTAARVADLHRVWIELAVFERELGHMKVGDDVQISPQTNQRLVVPGKIAHVGDVIDRDTRSAPVRVVVQNADESLRPGQSVLAKIEIETTAEKNVLVPLAALTSVDGKPTVFVAHDETSVEPRTITLGPRDANNVVALTGLVRGERVVVSGVFALKSEVFR